MNWTTSKDRHETKGETIDGYYANQAPRKQNCFAMWFEHSSDKEENRRLRKKAGEIIHELTIELDLSGETNQYRTRYSRSMKGTDPKKCLDVFWRHAPLMGAAVNFDT